LNRRPGVSPLRACFICDRRLGRSSTKMHLSTFTRLLAAAILLLVLGTAPASAQNGDAADALRYGPREDVMRFADDVAQRQGLDASWVRAALERARYNPAVARLIMPTTNGATKNWAAYRARFVEPVRLRAGLAFWRANERWLTLAEERFGVPPEIIVGIVGVESLFGQQTGNFRVIDALATLAFDFPPGRSDRAPFFRDELEAFFSMCSKNGMEPLEVKGSYAGAIGMPQFLPSSLIKYAVDLDDDGRIDLNDSPADVIGSVANYLFTFGWQRGVPTHFAVMQPPETADRAAMLVPDIVPTFTAEEFSQRGAVLSPAGRSFEGKLALVELQNGDAAPSDVAGTANFYVVTRYNWSSYYALAVIELGETLARERARAAR
jgi:membrane-bound lytic murein transglycosylase B